MKVPAKYTLLIVDDEPDVCDSVHDLLRREFRVLKAHSGHEGFELMQREEVHIIMTDQRMPQVSGVELLTKVKARNPQAVRMLFTGYADLESIIAAINQGHVYQFLKKPWQPEELFEAVRQAAVEYERLIADADHGEKLRDEIASLHQRVTILENEVRRLGGNPRQAAGCLPENRTGMPPDDRRHTLLIVDDEPGLLQSLRHQFFREYRVLTAESGHAGLEILGREDIHAILSDQKMPGMSGETFLAQALAIRPDAVRMLFTGYADIQAVITAVNQGRIFRYILKPWDPVELEGIVRQAIEHHDLKIDRRRLIVELKEANERLLRINRELAEANELKRALLETGRLRSEMEGLTRRVEALEGSGSAFD